MTPWTVACQALLSMKFYRQEYWSGLPFHSPGDLPDPGIKHGSPAMKVDSLSSELPGKPICVCVCVCVCVYKYIHRHTDRQIDRHGLLQLLSNNEHACNAGVTGDVGSIPGSGRSPEGGQGNSL